MMYKKMGYLTMYAGLLSLLISSTATAGTILVLGQTGTNPPNLVTGTRTGGSTQLSAADVPVTITAIDSVVPLLSTFPSAYLWISATSTSPAMVVSGQIIENFSGSFAITSGTGTSGVNYLSGTFTDSVFGSGTGLSLSASDAPPNPAGETVSFSSDLISNLQGPHAISFAFTNVMPPVTIVDGTIDSFSSNIAGSFSAVPEPASVIMLGFGLGTIAAILFRRRARV